MHTYACLWPCPAQVLSNPELRAKYDKYGSAALDVEFADPSMIFGMLFGSELFEPIVGEFLIAAATSKGRELTEKEINLMQVMMTATAEGAAARSGHQFRQLPHSACFGSQLVFGTSVMKWQLAASQLQSHCRRSGFCDPGKRQLAAFIRRHALLG